MKKVLIKVGGSVLESQQTVLNICEDIKNLKTLGIDVILVHGGGKHITKNLQKLGKQSNFVDGYRVTEKQDMPVLQQALYDVNKDIVKALNNKGVNAVGIFGENINILKCDFIDKEKYGYVGGLKYVNLELLEELSSHQFMPVIATVGYTDEHEAVNVNADDVAAKLAIACNVDEVIFLTDQNGVYDNNNNILSELSLNKISHLIETKIAVGGMSVKLNNIGKILEKIKKPISILNGSSIDILTKKIVYQHKLGTTCTYV